MKTRSLIPVVLVLTAALAGCGTSSSAPIHPQDRLEPIAGSPFKRIILTPLGAARIGIETSSVRLLRVAPHGRRAAVIPYSAVVYDDYGHAFTYTRPMPLQYVRRPIVVNHITGNSAFLRSALPDGTRVVSVGAEELYGIELGVTSGE
jgi:hypothetical protein